MLYPFTFHPIYKERIWGGRKLEELYGRILPPAIPIGESWEISDRPDDVSIISNGPLAGKNLRWLMEHASGELMGTAKAPHSRFPLLVKILDARERLSLQVHPPRSQAAALGGEAKTEMWYIVDAANGAELYVGLNRGVTKEDFQKRIQEGSAGNCVHQVAVKRGDAMFLPSGRVHSIGGGNFLFEIQQNSDTTYRVDDWGRTDSTGRPRALHINEALASIDFNDFEPEVIRSCAVDSVTGCRTLVNDEMFQVDERVFEKGTVHEQKGVGRPIVLGIVSGRLVAEGNGIQVELAPGGFCLVPGTISRFTLRCETAVQLLWAVPN